MIKKKITKKNQKTFGGEVKVCTFAVPIHAVRMLKGGSSLREIAG